MPRSESAVGKLPRGNGSSRLVCAVASELRELEECYLSDCRRCATLFWYEREEVQVRRIKGIELSYVCT